MGAGVGGRTAPPLGRTGYNQWSWWQPERVDEAATISGRMNLHDSHILGVAIMMWWLGLHGLPEVSEGVGGMESGAEILHLRIGDREWELAALGESATLADANGMTIYADIDGDGEVDHISTVHADGTFEVWSSDPHLAAWGLLTERGSGAAIVPVGGFGNWGLPESGTPEMGVREGGVDHVRGEWQCVDRG
ncbi:DUF6802 family protein [Corynebacterium sp. A21]|uniref:DUF6802 family protein n=1 Tax=Corynebacterium sp. A21 TaxID=3457318 RepID=UPI003FCFE985